MNNKPLADLNGAYVWDCDNCGTENWCRAITLSSEEAKELEAHEGIEVDDEGEWKTCPEEVTCSLCGSVYRTFDDLSEEFEAPGDIDIPPSNN